MRLYKQFFLHYSVCGTKRWFKLTCEIDGHGTTQLSSTFNVIQKRKRPFDSGFLKIQLANNLCCSLRVKEINKFTTPHSFILHSFTFPMRLNVFGALQISLVEIETSPNGLCFPLSLWLNALMIRVASWSPFVRKERRGKVNFGH